MKRLSGRLIIKYVILALSVILVMMPARVYAAEEMTATGRIVNDKLNVRSGPSTSDDVLGQLMDGDTVDITGVDGDWYRIEYDEEVGYVASKYVELIEGDGITEDDGDDLDEDSSDDETDKETDEDAADKDGESEVREFDPSFALIIGAIILLLVVIIFATVKSIRNLSEDDYDDYDGYDDGYGDDGYDEDEYEDDYGPDGYADDGYEEDDYEEEPDDEDYEDDYEDPAPVRRRTAHTEPQDGSYAEYDEPRRVKKVDLYPEEMAREKAARAIRDGADPARYMSNNPDDYRIDIDPSYFEKTGVLPSLEDIIEDEDAPKPVDTADDPDAPKPIGTAPDETPVVGESPGESCPDAEVSADDLDREAKLDEALKKMEELKAEIEKIKNEQT